MTTRTYPHGVPCWVDVEQPDLDAAQTFYGGLFGWTFEDMLPPEAPGSYVVARLDGRDAAALATPGEWSTGPQWNTYVAVDDAARSAAAVASSGGSVAYGPEPVGPAGTLAVCADPAGAAFRLWQPARRPGVQVANEPGAWNFSHLQATEPTAEFAFYSDVFGWKLAGMGDDAWGMIQVPGYGQHLADTIDPDIFERQAAAPEGFADVVAGLEPAPAARPAYWRVLFSVADRDGSAAVAERLGATVLESGDDTWTRWATVRDPQGAELTLSQFTPPDAWD